MKGQRIVINGVLVACVVGLAYICIHSITDQQKFDAEVVEREAAVKAQLLKIRFVEEAYKSTHKHYCGDWDELVAYAESDSLPTIVKQGTLSDEQLEQGLTEGKLAQILHTPNNAAEIEKYKLQGFVRDTSWVSVMDSLHLTADDLKNLRYIPSSGNQVFELEIDSFINKSEILVQTMECRAPYKTYMKGDTKAWERELNNREKDAEDRDVYGGLKIGEQGEAWNNNAGNWE